MAVAASPTVIAITPADGATGVSSGARPLIQFSELMDLATINGSTVTLAVTGGGATVPGVISFHGDTRILIEPSARLADGTTYVVTVTTGVRSSSGTPLAANFTSSFTTAAPPADVTAPTIVATTPGSNATNVAVESSVTATFSETMTVATISGASVSLAPASGGGPIAASVSYSTVTKTVTLTPASPLGFGTSYTFTISTPVRDSADNALASPFALAFTTAPAADVTSPTVVAVSPAAGASGVAANTSVIVTFDEPMAAATVSASTFMLTPSAGGGAITAIVTYNSGPRSATLTPSALLDYDAA